MPDQTPRDIDEWHLGIEAGDPRPPRPPVAGREPEPPDLSDDRLDVPIYVMTVEHLGWAVIALYALLTRLGALGLRPLNSIEASQALFARDMTSHGLSLLATEPRASGWIDPLRAGVMLVFGSSDYGVRIVAAMFGLMLIGAAFAMRRRLGRAGALSFAAMITLSPTLTYFSRSTSAAIPAIALVVVAVALMFALAGTSDTLKVAGVAVAIALALTAEAIVIPIAAMFLAILIVMGIFELFFRRNPMIRLRVWWERRSAQLVFCIAIAIGVFVVFESALGRRNLLLPMLFGAMQEWLPVMRPELRGGLDFYLPALGFYEFAIVITATIGALAFVTFQLRTRVAAIAFLWTILSAAFFLADPVHRPDWLVMMIVPAALLGAAIIDRIHRSEAWHAIGYPILALALLTIYVQFAINFVHVAPDPSEASWAHHMLLFWTDPATTTIAEQEFNHDERTLTERGTVYLDDQSPVARWYLRDLKPTDSAADADLVVSPTSAEKQANLLQTYDFTLNEKWTPSFANLTPRAAVRYFLTQRAWSDVTGTEIRVDQKGPTPAVVAAPTSSASPSASEAPTVEASSTPTAEVSGTPTPTPQATSPPPAEPTASAIETPSSAPTIERSPEAAPASTASP